MRAEFHVSDWLVEPQLNLLKRGDKSVHVEPKVMQVLLYLADRPGEVVSKKTLKKEIWEDAWVTDDALTRCISDLRKALEDDSKNPRVIQTIPRGGYRFIASVGTSGDTVGPPIPKFHRVFDRRWLLYTSIGLLAVAALLAIRWGDLLSTPTKISSIAVLPFQNISNDPEQEYLADAMTEALISDLANIDVLQVASRTSVMRYKGTTKPISEIAPELKVDALVEGSVVPAGGRVRITAQLIHGATDRHVWAGTYERDLSDVLFLQKEVARAVAQEVEITLTPADRERLSTAQTVDPIAYQAYVKGRYFASQRSEEGLKKAVVYWRLGQTEESLAEVRRLRKHWADEPARLDVLHSLYSGRKAEAIRRLDVLAASSSGHSGSATFLASGYALAGDHDKALAWLHQASAARDLSLLTIHVDPAYESLRSDPRFAELLNQIALKPNPGTS